MIKIDRLLKALQDNFKSTDITKVNDVAIKIQDKRKFYEPTMVYCSDPDRCVIWKHDVRTEFGRISSLIDYLEHNTIYE